LSRRRKVVVIVALVVVGLVGFAAVDVVIFRNDRLLGCRLFSVDQDRWVAANKELLQEVPVYPGSMLMYESSDGASVARDRCIRAENSGPYDSFHTDVRYRMPAGSEFADVAAFYRWELAKSGWQPGWHAGRLEFAYVRGNSFITVRSGLSETFWEFVVNHDRR
jgi:hypothetical protein